MFPLDPEDIARLGMGDVVSDSDRSDDDINQSLDISHSKEVVHSSKCQKRVQFLPDGILVRVREIPARSKHSSSESEGSASDSSSVTSDSGSDDTDPDIDDAKVDLAEDFMSPLLHPVILETKPLVTKKSSNVANHSLKLTAMVDKVFGVQSPHTSPKSRTAANRTKTKQLQSPKLSKRTQQSKKQFEKTEDDKKLSSGSAKLQTARKNNDPSFSKLPRSNTAAAKNATSSERTRVSQRTKSAQPNRRLAAGCRHATVVSTSLTTLPSSQDSQKDTPRKQVTKAIQSLTVEDLYLIDAFSSTSHQTPEVRLPALAPQTVKRESNFQSSNNSDNHTRRTSVDHTQILHRHQQQYPSKLSNKDDHAWQMTNGNIQSSLQITPSIAQLWDIDYGGFSDNSSPLAPIGKTLFNNIKKT